MTASPDARLCCASSEAARPSIRGTDRPAVWAAPEYLKPMGAIPDEGRVVRDGNVIAGGGVTAGIDVALVAVAEILGRAVAESIELRMEYAPAPQFGVGRPDIAPADLVTQARDSRKPIVDVNRAAVDKAVQRLR